MLDWPTLNTPNFPISMLCLKNIRLGNKHAEFERLLPLLRAPALEYATLKDFSARALHKLQELCLESRNDFPNVHDLILINCGTSTNVQRSTYKTLFPFVQTLTFRGALNSMQLFVLWTSLRRATIHCSKNYKLSLIKRSESTPDSESTTLTLPVPLESFFRMGRSGCTSAIYIS
ncbi:hypothetical protein CPB83DRAFT_854669 [Crepidotus variabilis]|uniref:Uncharacterized protein n=1 Tax=Crepidotus variabilis TaxID=179855 RepID=A0A9P6EFR2_9AGAR|nr:hypothetical protein CPB83DRAFT_854669 [Crepidotus variabilis]